MSLTSRDGLGIHREDMNSVLRLVIIYQCFALTRGYTVISSVIAIIILLWWRMIWIIRHK